MSVCVIFGAGERIPAERVEACVSEGDYLIAADGGLAWIREELPDIRPDLFVGDMDSLGEEFHTEGIPTVKLPVEKDDTDMGVAVSLGEEKGFLEFRLLGGTGGRFDHTIANLQLLKHIAIRGGRGFLIGPKLTATVVCADEGTESCIEIHGRPGLAFSVFAMGSAEGVTIRVSKYEATDVELKDDYALGVSNETAADSAVIVHMRGTLLIVGEFLPDDIIFR